MSNVSIVFEADTNRFRAGVDAAGIAVSKSADAVATAKNRIMEAFEQQAQKAIDMGVSQQKVQQMFDRAATQMATVTESNAQKIINSYDRIQDKAKATAAEMAFLRVPSINEDSDASSHGSGVTNQQRASALLRGGGLRAAENFAAQFEVFNKLAGLTFPILGATMMGEELFSMGERGYEAYQKLKHGAEDTNNAFEEMHQKAQITTDDLAIQNQKIQDQIDKLEHHPNNGLALALLEAKKNADDLLQSLQADDKAAGEIMQQHHVGVWANIFGGMLSAPQMTGTQEDQITADFKRISSRIQAERDKLTSLSS